MDFRGFVSVVRQRWIQVVVVALLVMGASVAFTVLATPKYTATTRLFFAVQGGETATDLAQGSTFAAKQMTSYAEVAQSPLVLEPVISDLRLNVSSEVLSKSMTVNVPLDTVILNVSVTDTSRQDSARIANAIGAQVSKAAANLSPERVDGSEPVRATTLAPATPPVAASSPNILRNLLLGGIFALVLALGLAMLRNAVETTVRGESDVTAITDLAVLGVIAYDESAPSHPVIMHDDPLGARSEAVRRLRTNLQFVNVESEIKSILVSSSVSGEGKSTTAINLAVSLSDAGKRVVLIDADLRRPSVAEYLGLEGGAGLTTVLIGKASVADVVQPWHTSSLDVLTSGQVPPNPSELLGSNAMSLLLMNLSETYDAIVLDSSPLLPVTDAAILSRLVGGTIVVVGADRVHRPQLRSAIESLTSVGANVLGIVLNKVAKREAGTYGYYADYAPNTEIDQKMRGLSDAPRQSLSGVPAANHDRADVV